jgi:hypothetical protein
MGKRAARGAGHHWGIAEEAGKAARWLAARGLPGPELLAGLLERTDGRRYAELAPEAADGLWRAPSGPLCPLIAGAALVDRAERIAAGGIALGPVSFPLLLAPYLAMAAKVSGAAMTLAWPGGAVTVFPDGRVSAEGALAAPAADSATCGMAAPEAGSAPDSRGPHVVADSAWSRLEALAQRTYAPATEASRILGAGAGLSDND